ncbi:MAG TPA: ATP-binding protein [Acidimicrobiales bacterium]|nr:ATP-binding protein [Acidimicrobiales bacterium]
MTLAEAVADVAAGVALLAAGVVTWARARSSRTGPLLALAGAAWLAGDVTSALVYAHRGPLVHALLTYPSGRTRSAPIVAVIALAYLDGLVPAVARSPWLTIALMAAVVGAAAWRWAAARGLERRARVVPLACAATVATPLTLAAVGRLAGTETDAVATWMYEAAIAVTAGTLAVNLLSGRQVRAVATGLVVDLGGSQEPQALRDALARTIGDPALEIAYRVNQEWVDEAGRPVQLPAGEESGERIVTVVEDGGTPVAALVHDPAALRDETLARSVAAAVRLALSNVRLQTDVAAHVREVAASRRRLVEAGDDQRRRLGEQLRGGAEQSLAEVSCDLATLAAGREGETAAALVALVNELDAARTDLARFARGVHPKALTEHGLSAALGELAGQAAFPVAVDVPSRRFPAAQEAAVFFVCSEALANVAKYAEASAVSIDVAEAGPRLVMRVTDDGRGGADPGRGSGLRGLADRVEALGGTLSVWSPPGAGTRLDAELPMRLEA